MTSFMSPFWPSDATKEGVTSIGIAVSRNGELIAAFSDSLGDEAEAAARV
jgi:hypothetical protein